MENNTDSISHATHQGGLEAAFLYLKGLPWFRNRGGSRRKKRKPALLKIDPSRHPDFY